MILFLSTGMTLLRTVHGYPLRQGIKRLSINVVVWVFLLIKIITELKYPVAIFLVMTLVPLR